MSSSTQTEWVNVTPKSKKSKKKQIFKIHKSNGPRFNFDSDESQPKHKTGNITKNDFPEISSKNKMSGYFFDFNDSPKKQDSWAVKLKVSIETPKTPIPVIKPNKPDPKNATYLYDWEVEKLCRTMNWGDFEVMMDDVIIIPDNQAKP